MFVSRERAYHGVNFGGVALSGLVNNRRKFGPGLPGVAHMRHTHLKENYFTQGEGAHGVELAEDLVRFVNLYGAENIAACFVEPIAGSSGCLVPPKGYLKRLREICDAHGILLVFDEVICGFGRTGPDVRRAELRRHAGPHDDGQGPHQRRAADGRGRGERAHPRHDHGGGARGRDRVLPRLHVFRPSGLVRRGPRDARHLQERGPVRARARAVAVLPRRDVLAEGRRQSSPTSAATACSRRSTSQPDGAPGTRGHAFQKKLFDERPAISRPPATPRSSRRR